MIEPIAVRKSHVDGGGCEMTSEQNGLLPLDKFHTMQFCILGSEIQGIEIEWPWGFTA